MASSSTAGYVFPILLKDFTKITLPEQAQKLAKPCAAAEFHAAKPFMGMRRTLPVNLLTLQSLSSELHPRLIIAKCSAADQVGDQIP